MISYVARNRRPLRAMTTRSFAAAVVENGSTFISVRIACRIIVSLGHASAPA
jgi:hypothetical protein